MKISSTPNVVGTTAGFIPGQGVISSASRSKTHNRNSLGTEMKVAENSMEEMRNKSDALLSSFQRVNEAIAATSIQNVIKTKHETVKNTLNNT